MKNLELDILQAALGGPLMKGKLGGDELISKYGDPGDQESPNRQLTVAIDDLVSEGYLHPYRDRDGKPVTVSVLARGITFKGRRRYRELRHPRLVWAERNWFPLTIAATTAAIPIVTKIIWG